MPEPAERRTRGIHIKLTPTEADWIADQARLARLTVSAFGRRRLLAHPVIAHADLAMVSELRRLGGLLKHLAQTKPEVVPSVERDAILAQIKRAIGALERAAEPERGR